MKFGIFLSLALFLYQGSLFCEGVDWGYGTANGPSTWGNDSPKCNDEKQSPINIVSADAVVDEDLGPFRRSIFDAKPSGMVLKNNGHTVQVDLTGATEINDDSLLPAVYKAAQFHLHWGGPDATGSEHTLNGHRKFGELHIVHYNTIYSDLGQAADKDDGLAVLGYFLVDDYPQDNLDFGRVLDYITAGNVTHPSDEITYTQTFSLETLMPPGPGAYFRYKGSLTTPPCYESVMWTVFEDVIRISESQADVLRTMVFEDEDGGTDSPIINNYRPVQSLNGREVKRYEPCSGQTPVFAKPAFHLVTMATIVLAYLSL